MHFSCASVKVAEWRQRLKRANATNGNAGVLGATLFLISLGLLLWARISRLSANAAQSQYNGSSEPEHERNVQ